jgi:beta-lactam-binding protein with PASTA domain
MTLRTRLWGAGKLMVLAGALVATYLLFAAAAMRLALKAREVHVPNMMNHTVPEARAMAGAVGLALRVDDYRRPDPKVAAGRVLLQEPAPGSITRAQRSIRVTLSGGQHAATVPALVGEAERTARLRLSQDGLPLAGVSEIRSQEYPSDVVIAQSPPARSAASEVTLLVNRAERGATYVMPDLIGVNGDRAAEMLRARGFRVAVVGSNPYPGVAPGVVLRQSPQAGFQIAPGEPISLEVSR